MGLGRSHKLRLPLPVNLLRVPRMAARKAKKKTFSAVKAVKANARERVGQPKPERVLADTPAKEKRKAKHKQKLSEIIATES